MTALHVGEVVKFRVWKNSEYNLVAGRVKVVKPPFTWIEYRQDDSQFLQQKVPIELVQRQERDKPLAPEPKPEPHGGIQIRMVQRRNKRTKTDEPADRQYKQYWFRWEHKGIKHSAYIRNSILWEVEESIATGKHWEDTLKLIKGSRNGKK